MECENHLKKEKIYMSIKNLHIRINEDVYNKWKMLLDGETVTQGITRLMRTEAQVKSMKMLRSGPHVIRVVKGKKYDTRSARFVSVYFDADTGVINALYKKKNGEFFFHCYHISGQPISVPAIVTKDLPEFGDMLSEMDLDLEAVADIEE